MIGPDMPRPRDVSLAEAWVLAEVTRLGGDEKDCRRLAAFSCFFEERPEFSEKLHVRFWREAFEFMIAHGEAITDDESGRILCWAIHRSLESQLAGNRPFSWKGRGVLSVLQKSKTFAAFEESTRRSNPCS
jgi:hypothetical protein